MKKTLKLLASAVLAASMLFAMSCSQEVEPTVNAEVIKDWKGQSSISEAKYAGHIKIELDVDGTKGDPTTALPITWWAVTDTHNVVLADSINNKNLAQEVKKDASNSKTEKYLDIDLSSLVKDADNREVVLWVYQEDLTKDLDKNIKIEEGDDPKISTLTGSIKLAASKGVGIKVSNYKSATIPVGILNITCNETGATEGETKVINEITCYVHNWHGNYRITKVAPLTKLPNTTPQQWKLVAGLEAKNFGNIEEGHNKSFIWPAGDSLVGVMQENRFDPANAGEYKDKEADAQSLQSDWYWTQSTTLTAYKMGTPILSNTSDSAVPGGLGAPKEGQGTNRSAVTPVIITEADLIPAGDLK